MSLSDGIALCGMNKVLLNWIKLNGNELSWTELKWNLWARLMELSLVGWTVLLNCMNRSDGLGLYGMNSVIELNWTELNWIVWTRLMDVSLVEWIALLNWTELTETDLNAPVTTTGQLHVPGSFHHCLHRLPRGSHPALWHLRRGQGAYVLAVRRSRHGHWNGGRPLHSPYWCQRHSQQLRRHRELWADLGF